MMYKYVVLKSSWGIAIWLDIAELIDPVIEEGDIQLIDTIYLRFSAPTGLAESGKKWLQRGLFSLADRVIEKRGQSRICFDVQDIHFNYCDYQEEGMYCAAREWVGKYYDLEIEPVEVNYDRAGKRYIFNID